MDIIKVAACAATSIVFSLLFVMVTQERSEGILYKQTVRTLMIQEECSSDDEVLDAFPELRDIQSEMDRISYLTRDIQSLTTGPAPNITREEHLQIQIYQHEINLLRVSVKEDLNDLVATYVKDRP